MKKTQEKILTSAQAIYLITTKQKRFNGGSIGIYAKYAASSIGYVGIPLSLFYRKRTSLVNRIAETIAADN